MQERSSLERDISLAFHESSLPRHILIRLFRQLQIKLPMRRPINSHALELPIFSAFVGIKESKRIEVSSPPSTEGERTLPWDVWKVGIAQRKAHNAHAHTYRYFLAA